MKNKSLVLHIRNLALSWTVAAMLLTLTLSGSLFFVLIYKDAERGIQSLATTTLASYRTDILSGDVRAIELQLNKEFEISQDEKLLFLDQLKRPWVGDLKDKKLELCQNDSGLCKDFFKKKVTLDFPIYFDSEKNNLWGYIHIEKNPHINWALIFSVILAILFGMTFQALGFYYNLSKTIKAVSDTISNWANKISANPKSTTEVKAAPYSEMEPIENALSGLRREIDVLEGLAREQGALNTLRGVGHDILNPVSRLKRLLGLIQIKMSESSNFDKELFQNCDSNLKRLSSYAEQLKILYKKKSGESLTEAHSALNVSKELSELIKEIASDSDATNKNIKLELDSSEDCWINMPSSALGRIFENIVGNSIHASATNSIIKVSSFKNEKNITMSFEDFGSGISEEQINKIFDPDFSTKANKGTGLGLFVVKQLCEQHSGLISVQSQINRGTKIQISFPRSEAIV